MSDRLTPETDTYCLRAIGFPTGYEWREFARKLERQRDEARDQLNRICRDGFGYQDTIGGEACADYALRKLNEGREELGRLRVENDHNWQAVAELEKMTELAWELRDALTGMEEYYRQHVIQGSLFLQVHAALTKAKEVLP